MTISPQGGDGCIGSNENQSRLERQLEWSRHIGINELKRIYRASLFLRCTAYLFHLMALLSFCMGVIPIFLYSYSPFFQYTLVKLGVASNMKPNPIAQPYPEWCLLCIGLLVLTQCLKRLKMPFLCRITITMLQIGLAVAAGLFFFVQVIYIEFETGIYYFWYSIFIPVLIFCILCILLKANCIMLVNSRNRQVWIFTIILSLIWGIAGLATLIILPIFPAFAAVWVLLMAGILWIAVFSKIRHQLFRNDALSHNQLCALLKQKKRDVPDDELVIPEDRKDISHKNFRQVLAWISLVVQIIVPFWIIYVQNYEWISQQPAMLDWSQKRPEKCPFCGSTDIVPILYGDGVWPVEGGRKFIPGGCLVIEGGPNWGCWDCWKNPE